MSRILAISNFAFGRACLLDKDRATSAHAHLQPHAMILVDGARQRYRVGSAQVELNREQAVLVNRQELHANDGEHTDRCVMLLLYFAPDWMAGLLDGATDNALLFPRPAIPMPPTLRREAQALADAMLHAEALESEAVQRRFACLARGLGQGDGAARAKRCRVRKPNDFRIRRAMALMQASIEEPLSATEICARIGLSRSRFFELFSACTGVSPKHYANMLRLEIATQRLIGAQDLIGDISHQCGFGAQSHFSKFFVDQQGFTPRELRRAAAPLANTA